MDHFYFHIILSKNLCSYNICQSGATGDYNFHSSINFTIDSIEYNGGKSDFCILV